MMVKKMAFLLLASLLSLLIGGITFLPLQQPQAGPRVFRDHNRGSLRALSARTPSP